MKREKKLDIYKIDNYLLFFGKIFIVFAVIVFIAVFFPSDAEKAKAAAQGKKETATAGDYLGLAFFFGGGTAMIAAGSRIRKKERKTLVLLKSLELTHELSVKEFLDSTGFSREDTETAFRTINTLGLGYYTWNRDTDTIVDGRLKRRMVLVDTCPACGKAVGQKYSLDLDSIPACPACGTPFNAEKWNNWRLDALKRIDRSDETEEAGKAKKFSPLVFVILLVVFWPAALAYFFFRYIKAKESGRPFA